MLLARIRRIVDPTYASALEPLPRGNGITLPMVLACVGVALALLRMHLIPTTLVDALMPKTDIELSADRSAMFLSVPSIAAVSAVRMIVAPPPAVETRASPIVEPRIAADLPAHASIAAPLPQLAPLRADPELKIELPVAAERTPAHVDSVAPASVPAPAQPTMQPTTRVAGGPEPVQMVPARYPLDALRSGVTGKVDLDFRIAADGSVRDVRVLHSQPSGIFEQAATAALRQWRFDVSGKADLARRYARSFAFARADASQETCREVTGSHICRKQSQELPDN
jgi:bla regulator protein BlaR1